MRWQEAVEPHLKGNEFQGKSSDPSFNGKINYFYESEFLTVGVSINTFLLLFNILLRFSRVFFVVNLSGLKLKFWGKPQICGCFGVKNIFLGLKYFLGLFLG